MNNIEQETICFQINLELGRFPGNHDYHVTYDPRCREIGVQLGELGVQWVPVDAEKFYSWLHNTPRTEMDGRGGHAGPQAPPDETTQQTT